MAEMRDDLNVVHFGGNSIAAHLEDAQATLETLSSDVTQALTKIEEGRKIDGNLGPAIENLGIAP